MLWWEDGEVRDFLGALELRDLILFICSSQLLAVTGDEP
jgi:hypothetical protein